MTNRWTVTFSREQLDAMWAKIDMDAIIARAIDEAANVVVRRLFEPPVALTQKGGRQMADAVSIKVEIDAALLAQVQELESLVESYAATNEAQRKRIDELLGKLAEANQRIAELDARCFELAKRLLAAAERETQRKQAKEVGNNGETD